MDVSRQVPAALSRGRNSGYPLDRRLAGLHSRSRPYGDVKDLGIETAVSDPYRVSMGCTSAADLRQNVGKNKT